MDKSAVKAISLGLVLVSTPSWSMPLETSFEIDDLRRVEYLELTESEMEATEGALAPAGIFALGVFFSAIEGGVESALIQHEETGEIKAGPIVFGAVVNAALFTLNAGAIWTKSAVVMTTVLGLDLALYASMTFGADSELADGTAEGLVTAYLDNYDSERIARRKASYEAGNMPPMTEDLSYLGVITQPGWSPASSGVLGAVTANGGPLGADALFGMGPGGTIEADLNGSLPVVGGAGETHYRYF